MRYARLPLRDWLCVVAGYPVQASRVSFGVGPLGDCRVYEYSKRRRRKLPSIPDEAKIAATAYIQNNVGELLHPGLFTKPLAQLTSPERKLQTQVHNAIAQMLETLEQAVTIALVQRPINSDDKPSKIYPNNLNQADDGNQADDN